MDRLRFLGCTLLAVAGTLFTLAPQANAQGREGYGVVMSIQFLENGTIGNQRVRELGAGAVRTSIPWNIVQPTPNGPFEFWYTDTMLNAARSAGLEIFANLEAPPAWAAACVQCMPYNTLEWYEYVKAVVGRYHGMYGSAITFGVWNEPNDKKFLRTSPGDDSGWQSAWWYYVIAYYAVQARNDLGNGARFAIGDMTAPAVTSHEWFDNFWYYMHPYLQPQDLIATHWYPNDGSLNNLLMQIFIRTNREIWVTETGPQTPTSDSYQVSIVNFLLDEFQSPGRYSFWTRFFYYRLRGDASEVNAEALVRPDWSPRPAFDTYKNRVPGGGPPPPGEDPVFYEHLDFGGGSFQRGTDWDFVGWDWNDQVTSVRVPAGVTVILYEHWNFEGASLTLTSDAADLRNFPGPGADGTWNDAASSIKIIR